VLFINASTIFLDEGGEKQREFAKKPSLSVEEGGEDQNNVKDLCALGTCARYDWPCASNTEGSDADRSARGLFIRSNLKQ
jgi:hypothetical protein